MARFRIFRDTDVLINWLAQEIDRNTGFDLWRCPYDIFDRVKNELEI